MQEVPGHHSSHELLAPPSPCVSQYCAPYVTQMPTTCTQATKGLVQLVKLTSCRDKWLAVSTLHEETCCSPGQPDLILIG